MGRLNLLEIATEKLTIGCQILDHLLGGGIPCGSITEIAGESGVGKTQICLQLALCALLPPSHGGLSASSLYIHSEFPFPISRLRQLSTHLTTSHSSPLDHVLVRGVHTADELLAVLDRLPGFISRPISGLPVKLIVVDSIAAVFRSDFDNSAVDLKKRSSMFFTIAAKLKELAVLFGLAVVVTNQIVDVIDDGGESSYMRVGNYDFLRTSGRIVCPALGISWANCVNTRLFLSRSDSGIQGEGRDDRMIQVVFAPHLPKSFSFYNIQKKGTLGVIS
ncbi:homolog of X-ray repair cross complementing 3 (XRCC3) [Wolffia australiana]